MNRGDVHELRSRRGVGHEQHGPRYGVVVTSDALLPQSVVVVAPTSTRARAFSYRPEVTVRGRPTRVLVEQIGAADVSRIGRRVGRLSPDERWSLDEALRTVLGLD